MGKRLKIEVAMRKNVFQEIRDLFYAPSVDPAEEAMSKMKEAFDELEEMINDSRAAIQERCEEIAKSLNLTLEMVADDPCKRATIETIIKGFEKRSGQWKK